MTRFFTSLCWLLQCNQYWLEANISPTRMTCFPYLCTLYFSKCGNSDLVTSLMALASGDHVFWHFLWRFYVNNLDGYYGLLCEFLRCFWWFFTLSYGPFRLIAHPFLQTIIRCSFARFDFSVAETTDSYRLDYLIRSRLFVVDINAYAFRCF